MSFMAFQGSIELGIIYAIMALGVFLSFRTLNFPDLTVDGSFVTGAAFSAIFCVGGYPELGLAVALLAGGLAGCVTALMHTKLEIQPLLAGILVMLGLYSVNLKIMGTRANIPLINKTTVFSLLDGTPLEEYAQLLIPLAILIILLLLLFLFLKTKFGFALRATGDNAQMVRALGVNTDTTILVGMALSNALVALAGALLAQYQSFTDIGMGIGMVVIGLASVIIGEVVFGTRSLMRRLVAVTLGAMLYRMIIAVALEMGMPATDLKLVSATLVALALAMPVIRKKAGYYKRKMTAQGFGQGGK
ncbi:MAG TPA: ABC transporter permease [Syntrophomonadaceae bacterium]|nr:ABC transporter permease [Syntrophomonadaceae bacterium]